MFNAATQQDIRRSPYTPRAQVLDFHGRWQKRAVLVFHRRAGKTVACINDLIDKAIQCELDMPMFGYICPLYKQAKRVAWRYLKYYAKDITAKVMESELSVELINGSTICLFGADNPDALRGMYFDGVILDEYGDMAPQTWSEVISPTLLDRDGWAVFIGTPKGPNHFRDLWKRAVLHPKWFTKMLRASESGILTDAQLEAERDTPGSDENTYRQEFECDFEAAIRGAYYGETLNKLEAQGHMGSFPYDPELPVLTAWDIGHTDDTSIWFFQTNGKEFKQIDFFTASGYSVDSIVSMLREKGYPIGTCYLPHDAKNKSFQTGKSTLELLVEAGLSVRIVAKLSVQDGIQAVRKTLPNVYFNIDNEDVRNGLDALRMYQREWDDKNKRFKESPKHDWSSNPADAFRYFACAMNPAAAQKGAQSTSPNKPVVPKSNVLTLDALFAERGNRPSSGRI
jgi:phage terminase large subunit